METFLWAGPTFCRLICKQGLPPGVGVYGFNTSSYELLKLTARQGSPGFVEQTIAPKRIECRLLEEERAKFPGWEEQTDIPDSLVAEYCQREEEEWKLADLIFCGSEFVKSSIRQSGGPADKCMVVPYGVLAEHVENTLTRNKKLSNSNRLRVLTVGRISLRKGVPYVMEVARQLNSLAEFRWVGASAVSRTMLSRLSKYVDLPGIASRSEMAGHYQWADVLFAPSVCEGSATVTYEALVRGLPVICTPNTGSMMRSGIDGILVSNGASDEMVTAIERLSKDRELLATLACNARQSNHEYSISGYHHRLIAALKQACSGPPVGTAACEVR